MNANFSKLPDFVGKVGDFAALASVTNLAKPAELKHKKEHEGLGELGETSKAISNTIHRFIKHIWCKFHRQDARAPREARRAEVCFLVLISSLLVLAFLLL